MSKPKAECATSCPIAYICGEQRRIVDNVRSGLFGSPNVRGITDATMAAIEGTEALDPGRQIPGLHDRMAGMRKQILGFMDLVEGIPVAEFDQAALEAQCDSPQENDGRALGADYTRSCGSLAIDDDTRTQYTVTVERAAPPTPPSSLQ